MIWTITFIICIRKKSILLKTLKALIVSYFSLILLEIILLKPLKSLIFLEMCFQGFQGEISNFQAFWHFPNVAIVSLLIYSNSTHLANFGMASLWPIYIWFGNISKYIHLRASSFSTHHLAFLSLVSNLSYWSTAALLG